jgi:GTP-binding protein EngB required for normal cell division
VSTKRLPRAGDPELVELLRRCRPDELEPLATLVGVRLGQADLGAAVREIDRRVRRLASNVTLDALLRRRRSYADVVRRIAERLDVPATSDVESTELAVARHSIAPPQIAKLERRSFVRWWLRWVESPPIPLPGCLLALWLGRSRPDLAVPAVVQIGKLRQAVRHRVTIGVVGSPSAGKDAALSAVFGIDTGNVNPVAGSTTEVEIRRIEEATELFVVNTPGLGDVVAALSDEARYILDHIDVFLYVVNAQGGVQTREQADHAACVARGRPVLVVVNKIDTIRPEDRVRFVHDCRVKLHAAPEDVVAAAFDPLPALAPEPIGVAAVRDWIERHLVRLGKDRTELPWVSS